MERAALLLTIALLAACGGSNEDERLSRDQLVERTGAICAEHLGAISRLDEGIDPSDDDGRDPLGDFARVLPQVADRFRDLADDLRGLEPPEDIEDQFSVTLDRIDRLADQLDEAAEEARAGDAQAMNAVLNESATGEAIERFFRDNGFDRCRSAD